MMEIENHWLNGDDITQMSCPKNIKPFAHGMPNSIIIHYTAGRTGDLSAKYLCKNNVKASAHIVIDRSGHIYQLVPFSTISWHAGKSSYGGRSGFNNFSIGIEIDNAGILEKVGNQYKAWFGKLYPESEVIQAIHRNESSPRYWHTYTEEQIQLTIDLCELLMDKYSSINNILGHEEISVGRKQDPGPAFPLDKIRASFFEDREDVSENRDMSEGYVDVPQLNIREMPSINSDLAHAPLQEGTKVKILQKHNGWYKVETKKEGWISGDYITFDKESIT
ncbi:N-acetylmuramoyl-L-alanine amidase [Xanthovirga aplysinae]|uniref:N-acetylmuramoyl-L-alanine amidase n=1 Tax=Xanthovirga aplysinae TaxID=2529853 RepID=UPI0012BB832D|nr:N-acetylmuramoyl-L-alanine amidase [Xanthovirga aplysinae]MTI29850.1 N-acetylmuramoyl-L-alanine amidase [Xanthovirga aplysinae]